MAGAGPTGGPALTDVLGVLEEWGERTLTVRTGQDRLVVVDRADVVAGKPVPPRPPVRLRVSVAEAEDRALEGWPPVESERVGGWVLRAAGGFSARANSALVLGDPGVGWREALARVEAFYADRGLPAWVQAMTGSAELDRLLDDGWVTARPGEADTSFRVAGLAAARRALAARLPADPPLVHAGPRVDDGWLADDARARAARGPAVAVLEGPPRVRFAAVRGAGGEVVAKARGSLSERSDVWVGVTDVWVSPGHRRRGLAATVLHALLGWAAEEGATSAYLQVREDNHAALALYDRVGFAAHHSYRYLRAPDRPRSPAQRQITVSEGV